MSENAGDPEFWIHETHKGVVSLAFKVEKTLFSGRSPYQRIDVVHTAGHGAMLVNDGIIMLSERDEFIYHEMIAHVPLFVHPDPRRVLIIGGGDGGTAREVLRHRGVERVVMVEIDAMVVEACRQHLPSVSGALDDPRLALHIADGVAFVRQTEERFDVAIIDSTDPVGPAEPLFDARFYKDVANCLADKGIMISQSESPLYDSDLQIAMFSNQRPHFDKLHLYTFTNLTYPGGLWSFGFASKGPCPVSNYDPERVRTAGFTTRYYNAQVHRAAFCLPECVNKSLSGHIDPVPDPWG